MPIQNGCQKNMQDSNQTVIHKITQQNLQWSPKISQNVVQTLLLLEKSQFPSSYIRAEYLGSAQIYWFLFGSLILLFCPGFFATLFLPQFYPINWKFENDIPRVLRYTAMTFQSHTSCSSGFIRDSLDPYRQ